MKHPREEIDTTSFHYCKVSRQGNITQLTYLDAKNTKATIIKLSAAEYVVTSTGEVQDFVHDAESRVGNLASLRRTFKRIRALVNTNCADIGRVVFITLTYAENMTDATKLYSDFHSFIKRFRYRWGHCEYIAVVEPQARGAWHMHMIAMYPHKAPFIENRAGKHELNKLWGHGVCFVRKISDCDNLGAYLSAYLGDIEVSLGTEGATLKDTEEGRKAFVKGSRLHLYPVGMQIYRTSKGIKQPEEAWVTPDEAKAMQDPDTLTYERLYEWTDETGERRRVLHRYYNRLRKNSRV
jgi:hypothetical protein